MLNKVAFTFRTRDAGLATLISLAGVALLIIALAFHHWTGVAAGAGLVLLGIEAHVLQKRIGEKSSKELEQSTTQDVLKQNERGLLALNRMLQQVLNEQFLMKKQIEALQQALEHVGREAP